jgi:hypothetical protein
MREKSRNVWLDLIAGPGLVTLAGTWAMIVALQTVL